MNERERLKQCAELGFVQSAIELACGADVDKAREAAELVQKAAKAGAGHPQAAAFFAKCESPAERQFALGLFLACENSDDPGPLGLRFSPVDDDFKPEVGSVWFWSEFCDYMVTGQVEVSDIEWECQEHEDESCDCEAPPFARCDFFIRAMVDVGGGSLDTCVVVEVDGHEFHDRTKEQAARDRKRDRRLLCQPGPEIDCVLRFTASEVFSDPMECAREAYAIARQRLHSRVQLVHIAMKRAPLQSTKEASE